MVKEETKLVNFNQFENLNEWGELPEDKDGKKLNNPTKGNVKNYKVYVKNDKEDVVKIEFDTLKQEHFTTNLPKWKTQYWSSKIGVNR